MVDNFVSQSSENIANFDDWAQGKMTNFVILSWEKNNEIHQMVFAKTRISLNGLGKKVANFVK